MDKEDVAHIYNGILISHKKKEIELFVVRWMDPESVILSEVISQKEKNKYRMLTHIYGNLKKNKKCSEEARGRTGIKTQT